MSESLSSKCVLVCDNGLFAELACRLTRQFGRVLYFMPWANAYPKSAAAFVGTGLEGVERVPTFWDRVAEADLVVFPDVYFSDAQEVVRERFHKPVWGHGSAEALELDRVGTRALQRRLGVPGPPSRRVVGIGALAEYLADPAHENRWLKISTYRGDGETFHHETWHTTRVWLDRFRDRVGPVADEYEFLVERHLEGIEVGYDGWTVHGQFPTAAYWGFEVKDEGYVGRFQPYREMPACIREVNERMSPVLAEARAVGFCSFEFRLGEDGVARMIDPCMRAGSPPFEATQEAYANLGEILWEGAHGRLVEPAPLGEYIAEALIHSQEALTNWVPLECPPADRRWLKVRNVAVVGGELYHVPVGGQMPEIGAVVAAGDTLEEAIGLVKERAERIKGFGLQIKAEALDRALEEVEEARKYGVEFL
jgi:hypothetical protein